MKRENLKPKDEEELTQILSKNILERYDNKEYWDQKQKLIESYLQEKEEEYKKKKKYRVGYWQTDYGYFEIEAKDEKEAREIAEKLDDTSEEFVSKRVDFGIEEIEEI